ncbi:MAG: hypothetical protein HC854_01030 [Flavobacterium sp.]|nr:hypothetical protein [Flavobacterium sp.]
MKKFSSLILFFSAFFGLAQNYKGEIKNIKEEGLHQILISPEVRAVAHENLDYFRIFDSNKTEVPYVIYDNSYNIKRYYAKSKILSKTILKDSLTSIVIPFNCPAQKYSTELSLKISNTKINKTYTLSGSNDQKEWFGIVANQMLSNLDNENDTFVEKIISFPSNNYEFLKIELNDRNSLPINILEIGYYKGEEKVVKTSILDNFKYKISENKEDKKTIISFSSDNFQKVDGISFEIKSRLFSREARLFVNKKTNSKKTN